MNKSQKTSEHILVNTILKNCTDYAITITDFDLRVTHCNPLAEKLFGCKEEDVVGKTIMEIYLHEPAAVKRFHKIIEEVQRLGAYEYMIEPETEDGGHHLRVKVIGLAADGGGFSGYILFSKDVTQERKLTESLKESESSFRFINEHMSDVYYRAGNDGKIIATNPAALKLYGYDHLEELIGKPVLDFYYDENDNEAFMKELKKNGLVKNYPLKHKRKNGEPLFVEINSTLLFDKNGNIDGVVGLLRDITERYLIEEQLKKYRILLETSINAVPYMVCIKDGQGRWLLANEYTRNLFQLKGVDYQGKTDIELSAFNNYYRDSFLNGAQSDHKAWQHGTLSYSEEVIPGPDGSNLIFDIAKIPLFNSDGSRHALVVTGFDITEQKKIEEKFRDLYEKAPLPYQSLDADGCLVDVNHVWLETLGYTREEVIGRSFADFLLPEERPFFYSHYLSCETRGDEQVVELKLVRKDGTVILANFAREITYGRQQQMIRSHCIFSDITKQRQTENERIKLVSAIEQTTEVIVITNTEGTIEYVNPAFVSLTGYNLEEAVGKTPRILKSGRHDQSFYHEMWDTLLHDKVWRGRLIDKKKDGTLFEQDAAISPVKNTQGETTHFVAVKRDVSREMALESQLQQAQKMESIGTLAGGIAHDFNNILTAILGYAELAKNDLPADSKANKKIDKIINAGERATGLVKQILDFSRKGSQHLQLLMPHLIVKEVLKMMSVSLPTTITIEKNIDPEVGLILADPTHIHQIVMNLMTNAFQSMKNEKGVLSVSLSRRELGPEEIKGRKVSPGTFIVLSVSDTGYGMDKSTRERIFEPYFTTKERGKGTGLGLAVVYGIVKKYQGFIRVESEPGQGTSFHVYFPAMKKNIATSKKKENEKPLPTGTERILVIDDEDIILNLHEILLKNLGYRVTATMDSLAALEQIRAHPDYFDLIVTDQTMPNLSGAELAREVLRLRPNMPIILCTGYSSVVSVAEALAMGIKEYVKKPVKPWELAQLVRQVLDQK